MAEVYRYYRQLSHDTTDPNDDNNTAATTTTIPPTTINTSYTRLCRDLQYHWDDFLTGLSTLPTTIGNSSPANTNQNSNHVGGYHHVTEYIDRYHIPTTTYSPPTSHSQEILLPHLPAAIHRHLTSTERPSVDAPYVVGVSTFRDNELMPFHVDILDRTSVIDTASSQHIVHTASTSSNGTSTSRTVYLPDEVALLLFQYMKQIQLRMLQQQQPLPPLLDPNRSTPTSTTSTTKTESWSQPLKKSSSWTKLLRPFALSFLKDDCIVSSPMKSNLHLNMTTATTLSTTSTTTIGNIAHNTAELVPGTFLSPPPFSLMSVLDDDQITSFVYQEAVAGNVEEDNNMSTVYVWAPSVTLPITTTVVLDEDDEQQHERTTVSARMCLYMRNDIQCLIYLSRPDLPDHEDHHHRDSNSNHRLYQNLFHHISQQIDIAINEVTTGSMIDNDEKHPNDTELVQNCSSSTTASWDIQYNMNQHSPIPRSGLDLLIIDRMKHTISIYVDENNRYPPDITGTPTNHQKQFGGQHHPNGPSLSLDDDFRNVLLQNLTFNTVLALEDAIEEVQQYMTASSVRRTNSTFQQQQPPPSYESCTLLPHQWVYSYCACHIEMYVLFHTTHYVTISDVQQEAHRIQNVFFSKL